ncbi:MAG: secretin N-terminal domain-containing protein [Phycisphaerales bacterium]
MAAIRQTILAGIFFVALGSVYSGSANGESPLSAVTSAIKAAAGGDVKPAADTGVKVSSYDTVSLNVANADLAQVLQLLSIQGRRNIVPSSSVKGSVTANLYDVTFYEALDAILQQNGCGFREKGNFIYIYTADELKKIEQTERKVTYQVVKLNYITASDAATFVTPLLSSAGSIAVSGNVGPGFVPSPSDGGANSFAHPDTMVIRDYPENIEEIKKVIAQLDERPRQVLVEATILKADLTESTAFGVDFSILSDVAIKAMTSPLSGVGDLIAGTVKATTTAATSTVGNVSEGAGGLKVGIVTNNVAAFIRALDSVTDTTIIANPKIMALNRQRADVLVGEKVGYLSTTATATATTQTVEFLDTGTQLSLRPFISDDGFIRLELKPSISSATIRNVVPGTTTAAVTVPDEDTQELTTNIMVQDGQTVVLGGLFKEETTTSRDQIPLLGDIPIAGAAFKGKDDTVTRSEVIFLITTHILKDHALIAAGDAAKDSVEMTRLGAREGLLPWSRSKMTAAQLRDALQAIDAGDRDKALYHVDLALSLDPRQVEAIRLKEKLTGQRIYWPERSMLDEAVDVMVEKQTGQPTPQTVRPTVPNPRPTQPTSDAEPLFPAAPGIAPVAPAPGTAPAPAPKDEPAPRTSGTSDATQPSESTDTAAAPETVAAPEATPAPEVATEPAPQATQPAPQADASTEATEPAPQAEAATQVAEPQPQTEAAAAATPTPAAPADEPAQHADVLRLAIQDYLNANPGSETVTPPQAPSAAGSGNTSGGGDDDATTSVDEDAGAETE